MEEDNRASVNRIKKMIIATICILIFVPIILCIVLMIRIGRLEKKFDEYLKNNSQSEVEVATENDAALAEARIWQTTEVADVPSPKQQMAKEDADAINDLDKQVDDSSELISLYYGADVSDGDAGALKDKIAERFPGLDVDIQRGGQPVYYYITSVE